ncbi:uncharacterized protein SCHCODRAFT_02240148 [Schizophyllum commune H4-8]|uniref:uncharacterized protein n=1 Tax=Schizophyllum commune (strain H4-8 / FGSC 9210) TaxID=578458 RepID=UPI002160A04A|nr:uncharacterized protein SCHCODRAFT_02240148 [Schizophyllum commune H4-8]KAI5895788.1 hypothetical protein SCHCODRAFT_02240148 [Schizophyllum commune H4-8]
MLPRCGPWSRGCRTAGRTLALNRRSNIFRLPNDLRRPPDNVRSRASKLLKLL